MKIDRPQLIGRLSPPPPAAPVTTNHPASAPVKTYSPPWDSWDVHLAESCRKVYRPRPEVEAWLKEKGATDPYWIENGATETQGVAYCLKEHLVVVFRGTQEALDWVTDLAFLYAASPPRHFGFWLAWRSVKGQVESWAARQRKLPMLVSGHSLGGALATLAAFDLAETNKIERVTTFGSPRVGPAEFARAYTKRGLTSVTKRFVHVEDSVTALPPVGMFLAVGKKIALARPLEREDFLRRAGFAAPESTAASMVKAFWSVGLNLIHPVLGNINTTRPDMIASLPAWASPDRASLLRKDWSDSGAQLLVAMVFLAFPFFALYLAFHPLTSELAVLSYLNRAPFARLMVTAFLAVLAQQAAFVLAWKCPFVVRFPASVAAGLAAFRWLELDRASAWHAWGVVLMALVLSMVLYRFIGAVVDHPMELYVVALGGTKIDAAGALVSGISARSVVPPPPSEK